MEISFILVDVEFLTDRNMDLNVFVMRTTFDAKLLTELLLVICWVTNFFSINASYVILSVVTF